MFIWNRKILLPLDYYELKKIVRKGEGFHTEFKLKANHPKKIVREAVAFANSEGGLLIIGVNDDKDIRGLKYAEEDEYVLCKALEENCSPHISYNVHHISGRKRTAKYLSFVSPKAIWYTTISMKMKTKIKIAKSIFV